MKNVVFVSVDNYLAKLVARKFATDAGLEFVDVDEALGAKLLNTFDFPLDKSNEVCENIEQIFLQNLGKRENQVAYVSNETFISNREQFKDFMIILIKKELDASIQANIQELMKKSAKIIINEKSMDIKSLEKQILKNLK